MAQQFELAARIQRFGMMLIIELEMLSATPNKIAAEALLLDELNRQIDAIPVGQNVILKLAIPNTPNL